MSTATNEKMAAALRKAADALENAADPPDLQSPDWRNRFHAAKQSIHELGTVFHYASPCQCFLCKRYLRQEDSVDVRVSIQGTFQAVGRKAFPSVDRTVQACEACATQFSAVVLSPE